MTTKTTAMLYMWSVKRSQRSLHVPFWLDIRNCQRFQLAIQIEMGVFSRMNCQKGAKVLQNVVTYYKKLVFMEVLRSGTLHK